VKQCRFYDVAACAEGADAGAPCSVAIGHDVFMATTYDGLPISATPPFGATIVVSCLMNGDRRYLLLHRAHAGPAYEGDWAWTPPAGSRLPDEPIEICAVRELAEETGLSGVLRAIYNSDTDWALFALDLDAQPEVTWMGNTTATNG